MLSQLIIAGVVGIMLFFTVAVAPSIFKVLPQEWAGIYVRAFFPKYYAALGVVTLLGAAFELDPYARAIYIVVGGLFFFSLFVMTPQINKARDAEKKAWFGALHGFSVMINMAQLGLLIWMLWKTAAAQPLS